MRPLLSPRPIHVLAVAALLGGKPALAQVKVRVTAPADVLFAGSSLRLQAQVEGSQEPGVTWTAWVGSTLMVDAIDANGLFTPPAHAASDLYLVRATSVAEARACGEMTVAVVAQAPSEVGSPDRVMAASGWTSSERAPALGGMPFLDVETHRRYLPGKVQELGINTFAGRQVLGYGLPVAMELNPAHCRKADGLWLSYWEGGNVLRRNATAEAPVLRLTGLVRDCSVEALRRAEGGWTSTMERYSLQVRGLVPFAGRSQYGPQWDAGDDDGRGEGARFRRPMGLAMMSTGTAALCVVADGESHVLRTVAKDGTVATLAGKAGTSGYQDGPRGQALFRQPTFLATQPDLSGGQGSSRKVVVADTGNHAIRVVDEHGQVTTLAGTGQAGFKDSDKAHEAQFNNPQGVAMDGYGNVFVADAGNHRIRKIDTQGRVTTLAGTGVPGQKDGASALATFTRLKGLACSATGVLYVVDGHSVRLIDAFERVATVVGQVDQPDFLDMPMTSMRGHLPCLNSPSGLAWSGDTLIIADEGNHAVRHCRIEGAAWNQTLALTTAVGDPAAGATGWGLLRDGCPGPLGAGYGALSAPRGVTIDAEGNVYASTGQAVVCLAGQACNPWGTHLHVAPDPAQLQPRMGKPIALNFAASNGVSGPRQAAVTWTLEWVDPDTQVVLGQPTSGRASLDAWQVTRIQAQGPQAGLVMARIKVLTDGGVTLCGAAALEIQQP